MRSFYNIMRSKNIFMKVVNEKVYRTAFDSLRAECSTEKQKQMKSIIRNQLIVILFRPNLPVNLDSTDIFYRVLISRPTLNFPVN